MNVCSGRKCRSVGDKRRVRARRLCSACYMRARRAGDFDGQRVAETEDLTAFLETNAYNIRRAEVRRLLDGGTDLPQIVQAFVTDPRLHDLIRDSEAPLTVLKRDVAYWRQQDRDTPAPIRSLEKIARYINNEIANPATTAAARISLMRQLAKVEDQLSKLRGQVRYNPGVGLEVVEDDKDAPADPVALFKEQLRQMGVPDA